MRPKSARNVLWPGSRETSACGFIYTFIVLLAVVLVVLVLYLSYQRPYEDRIRANQGYLSILRTDIQFFVEQNCRYPHSLDEFRLWSQAHGGRIWDKMYVDLNSEKQTDVPDYRELNDKGGYYYDPNTGEIRLNLTRPVKEYLPGYRGRFRNDIPSSW